MRKIMGVWAALAAIVLALGLVITSGSPAEAAFRMQISEIFYNSPGPDTGSNASLNAEWVQLHNSSGSRLTLTGWTVRDRAGHIFRFGTFTIKAHGFVKIHTGKGRRTQTDRYWGRSSYVWNNDGEKATLRDNHGNEIDHCAYRDPSESNSFKIC
jgi:Lamin Tail Domain